MVADQLIMHSSSLPYFIYFFHGIIITALSLGCIWFLIFNFLDYIAIDTMNSVPIVKCIYIICRYSFYCERLLFPLLYFVMLWMKQMQNRKKGERPSLMLILLLCTVELLRVPIHWHIFCFGELVAPCSYDPVSTNFVKCLLLQSFVPVLGQLAWLIMLKLLIQLNIHGRWIMH